MHVNLLPATREQITALVQNMHLAEADIIGFAVQTLYDEKYPRHSVHSVSDAVERPRRTSKNDHESDDS